MRYAANGESASSSNLYNTTYLDSSTVTGLAKGAAVLCSVTMDGTLVVGSYEGAGPGSIQLQWTLRISFFRAATRPGPAVSCLQSDEP